MITEARPASRTFLPVTDDSERLRVTLPDRGLASQSLLTTASRLIYDLALAGTMTRARERRDELELHIRYWAAVRRTALGSTQDTPKLEDWDKAIRDLPTERMLSEATTGAGLSQFEVRDFDLRGIGDRGARFLAEGCRLVNGTLADLRTIDLSLWESGLFGVTIEKFSVSGLLQGRYAAAASTAFSGKAKEADFANTVFRDVDISLVAEKANFDDTNYGRSDNATLLELLPSKFPRWPVAKAATRFHSCDIHSVSFRRAALQKVRFADCHFAHADFSGAELTDASFERCTIGDRPASASDLAKAADAARVVFS